MSEAINGRSLAIGHTIEYLLSGSTKDKEALANWPPDVFALVGSILKQSGRYIEIVNDWPPGGISIDAWASRTEAIGKGWRSAAGLGEKCPSEIAALWALVLKAASDGTLLCDAHKDGALFEALVSLMACSDEASSGVGIVDETKADKFISKALEALSVSEAYGFGSSLCRSVHPSIACVLPKLHTPLSGITFRSLTHHLALWDNPEVRPFWNLMDLSTLTDEELNVLLLPWPLELDPSAFSPVDRGRPDMSTEFGFFSCDTQASKATTATDVSKILKAAVERCGRIDMVVLPEACLREAEAFEALDSIHDILVVGGVGGTDSTGEINKTIVGVSSELERSYRLQPKHHRWRLDQSQIHQYGLTGRFPEDRKWWWESIKVHPRECNFYNVNTWLTVCVLICEDLARQDPVAELVRSVGPSLVVALLLDGPQLVARWPTRYATILADDPRCSVLTLTCAGAVDLTTKQGLDGARSVALWKDALNPMVRQIELAHGAQGIVLHLKNLFDKEWSADGRHDGGATPYLTYRDATQISVPEPA